MKLAILAVLLCLSFFISAQVTGTTTPISSGAQIVSPVSGDENYLYYFMRIEWDPYADAFLGKTYMSITLNGDNGEAAEVTTNFPINENISSFDWVVYGVMPTTAATLTFVVEEDPSFDSDEFTISGTQDNTACTGEGDACLDNLECCSGDCTSGVCGDSPITCLHDGALCSPLYACCDGGCNGSVCGDATDCVLIGMTCTEDEQCCSDSCNESTFMCEAAEPAGPCVEGVTSCTANSDCDCNESVCYILTTPRSCGPCIINDGTACYSSIECCAGLQCGGGDGCVPM